jgi:hypothetical protein
LHFARKLVQGVVTGPITDSSNGYSYYLLTPDTWTNSESEAVAMGGHLATVNNPSENSWILNTLGPLTGNDGANLWIGLYDPILNDGTGVQHAADFIWSSGAPVTYTNWGPAEPDNSPYWGGEYYTILEVVPFEALVPGVWNDQSDTSSGSSDYGVVEVVPEPTGITIVAVMGLLTIRRRSNRESRAKAKRSSQYIVSGKSRAFTLYCDT